MYHSLVLSCVSDHWVLVDRDTDLRSGEQYPRAKPSMSRHNCCIHAQSCIINVDSGVQIQVNLRAPQLRPPIAAVTPVMIINIL
jgi:hypothetical protein